ncbi:hypothetical protein B7Z28_02235 [Candidatus Saccharibacteria bacterium 32-45-3]|nr:MAG: hypothetical protein B7Z28_02235 [Candidatus Saccharibacteria bacterium 32-45-3]
MYRVRNINNLRTSKAFTVVELIIVVVVIAILAALVTVAYQGITEDTRDTSAKSTAEQISKKLEVYMTQNAGLPDDLSEVGFTDNGDTTYYYEKAGASYFCASVTVGDSSYHVTYDESQAQSGTCDGSGGGGGATLPPLVGEWLFNEGTGTTAADSSGNGYALSRIGGSNAVWVATGHSGAGFKPTASWYFERASFGGDILKTWTVTLWFKREGATTAQWSE